MNIKKKKIITNYFEIKLNKNKVYSEWNVKIYLLENSKSQNSQKELFGSEILIKEKFLKKCQKKIENSIGNCIIGGDKIYSVRNKK